MLRSEHTVDTVAAARCSGGSRVGRSEVCSRQAVRVQAVQYCVCSPRRQTCAAPEGAWPGAGKPCTACISSGGTLRFLANRSSALFWARNCRAHCCCCVPSSLLGSDGAAALRKARRSATGMAVPSETAGGLSTVRRSSAGPTAACIVSDDARRRAGHSKATQAAPTLKRPG